MKIGSIPTLIGHRRILLDKVGSTQDFAMELLKSRSNHHGTVILAHAQENGKGRLDKKWESQEGQNFIGSIIIHSPPALDKNNFNLMSMFTAIAVHESIASMVKAEVKIKWPNDILVSNKKVAGILIHNLWRSQHPVLSILGIGVNINQSEFPSHLSQASSLKIISQSNLDKAYFTELLIASLNKWYTALCEDQYDVILRAYHARLFGLNEQISFEFHGSEYFGKIIEVSANGKINIQSSLGQGDWYEIDQIKINY
jgi:BirA family biotin operon repressor/biotin-[acetyl-CoA-carboxylase] ligase